MKPDFWNGNILLLSARHKLFIVYYRNIYINTRGGVYTSQLISYSRTCVQYTDSLDRAQLRTQKLHKQDYVEVIATNTLRSLSRSGWLLRDIHISNDNGCFIFYVDLSLRYHCQYLYRTWLYIWVTRRVSNKKQDLLALREHMSSPPVVRDAHLFSGLCCPIICLYVLSSVLWCPLRFLHINDVWFVFTSSCLWDGSSPIYVICSCLRSVVCCCFFVFLFWISSFCVLCTQGWSVFDCPSSVL